MSTKGIGPIMTKGFVGWVKKRRRNRQPKSLGSWAIVSIVLIDSFYSTNINTLVHQRNVTDRKVKKLKSVSLEGVHKARKRIPRKNII